ncbi:MAG: PAS domain S-box protein, partial [Anaerolineaceae bacterium]|nr:PAS domain S-box protein [Anaerolineaceae bacterium]
ISTSLNEIYLFDADTMHFRFVNDGALKNLGYSIDQMQSMTPLNIKPEFTVATFRNVLQPLLDHVKPELVLETVHQRSDGSLYPVEVHLQLFEYEGERVFLAVINDITERKQFEESLKESEARMVQAQAVAHVGNWEINLKEKTMWGSAEAFRIYGLERSSPYLPLDQAQRIPLAEDRPRLDAELNNLLHGLGLYGIKYRIRRASDNAERVIHSVAKLESDEQGVPKKVIGTIQDVTEMTQTKQSLIESELRFRTIFQKSHAVMFWLNPENGAIVDANPAASDFYGWTHEELISMNINQINTLPGEEIQRELQVVRREHRKSFIFQHRKKNGQICDVEVFSGQIQLKGEDFLFSIVHDITDRKKAEVQVAEQLEELQRWYRATLNRETRVLELKQEINELLTQYGEPPRYNNPQMDTLHE